MIQDDLLQLAAAVAIASAIFLVVYRVIAHRRQRRERLRRMAAELRMRNA
jgi:hypothetical protein